MRWWWWIALDASPVITIVYFFSKLLLLQFPHEVFFLFSPVSHLLLKKVLLQLKLAQNKVLALFLTILNQPHFLSDLFELCMLHLFLKPMHFV
jgi:hypothetical protein